MFIERDLLMRKIPNFIKSVKPLLDEGKRADEVIENDIVIGWEISEIPK